MKNFLFIFKNCKVALKYIVLLIISGGTVSFLSVFQAICTKNLLDGALSNNNDFIFKWTFILLGIVILNIMLKTLNTVLNSYTAEIVKNTLQKNLYSHVLNSPWSLCSTYHSVDILTRFTGDISVISNFICSSIPQGISLIIMFVSSFFALIFISPIMAIMAICIFPIMLILSKLYGRILKKFYIDLQKKESFYNSFVQESFSNLMIIKSFCVEESRVTSLCDLQEDKLKLHLKKSFFSAISNSFISFSSMIGTFVVLCWGVFKISSGELLFGSITAMIQLFANIQTPILGLSSLIPQFISSIGACDRVCELVKLPIEEGVETSISPDDSLEISFNNVCFGYSDDKLILKDVNFKASSGDVIKICGPSGVGKTTFFRVVLSFVKPTSGEILINNESLDICHRKLISYVPQGNTLFSGSILDNLLIGNSTASMDDISNILKLCCCDFVYALKDGINSVIGEKGIGLSEGQCQRLCIARALLKKSPILLLDEATSALDLETENKILEGIKKLEYKPLCLTIRHF
ncbi:MAG: ABC transporter ATP-binding protein [Clostridium sp.]